MLLECAWSWKVDLTRQLRIRRSPLTANVKIKDSKLWILRTVARCAGCIAAPLLGPAVVASRQQGRIWLCVEGALLRWVFGGRGHCVDDHFELGCAVQAARLPASACGDRGGSALVSVRTCGWAVPTGGAHLLSDREVSSATSARSLAVTAGS